MGIFFESRPVKPVRDVVEEALRTPADQVDVASETARLTQQLDDRRGQFKASSLLIAVLLLAVFAALAVAAEYTTTTTATAELWKAFHTILALIVGLLGGEAVGRAEK